MAAAPTTPSGYSLNATSDMPDVRDRMFLPTLEPVPDIKLPERQMAAILDQGREGACTGFGLAAVINLQRRGKDPSAKLVSPRMLYEMAKRFDEWSGEDYDGSSARGALRGYFNNGVCLEDEWRYDPGNVGSLTLKRARGARNCPLGAYYRVRPDIAEMHSAINQAGAVYVTARVHDGWFAPVDGVIEPRKLHAEGGHAFAVVGYTAEGFFVQNSWGPG